MILLFAVLFLAAAVFFVGEAATYPARLKARSVRRAANYGRVRIPRSEKDLVKFRERVFAPAALKFAAIPLKLNPRTSVDAIQSKIVAAGLTQRLNTNSFLAIKGGATVAGAVLGLL